MSRKYFDKVLNEKGKSRGKRCTEPNRRKDIREDHLPSREGILGKHRSNSTKCSGYNTDAVKRLIASSVGKKWDNVNSETLKGINKSNYNASNAYRWGVEIYLATGVVEIRTVNGRKVPYDSKDEPVWDKHWVHHKTGLVMAPVNRTVRPRRKTYPKYIEKGGKFYRVCYPKPKKDQTENAPQTSSVGNWFEVELEFLKGGPSLFKRHIAFELEDGYNPFPVYDAVAGKVASPGECLKIHGKYAFARRKRQLNKTEIKRLELENCYAGEPPDEVVQP